MRAEFQGKINLDGIVNIAPEQIVDYNKMIENKKAVEIAKAKLELLITL